MRNFLFFIKFNILVLDVYSEWAGPCVGMVGYLKKAKLEIGGDFLHLAVCKSDTINKLKRFRNRSEPTWVFCSVNIFKTFLISLLDFIFYLQNHKIINLLMGCNVPRLMAIIIQELKLEEQYKAGEYERIFYEFDQLLPDEQERAVIKQQIEEETGRLEMNKRSNRERITFGLSPTKYRST